MLEVLSETHRIYFSSFFYLYLYSISAIIQADSTLGMSMADARKVLSLGEILMPINGRGGHMGH